MKAGEKLGMHLNLFFYLSDTGAFASNQKAPAEWQNYSLEETAGFQERSSAVVLYMPD